MTEKLNYAKLIEQGLGNFNEDGEWIWTLVQSQIVTRDEAEEADHEQYEEEQ